MKPKERVCKKAISIVSFQIMGSRKKTSFHFIADELHQRGWDVTFVTTGISYLDLVKPSARWTDARKHGLNEIKLWEPGLRSYIHCPAVHPKSTRVPQMAQYLRRAADHYRRTLNNVSHLINDSDVILFESCDGLLLLDGGGEYIRDQIVIYRPSDQLGEISINPSTIDCYMRNRDRIDLFVLPSKLMDSSHELYGVPKEKIMLLEHGVPATVATRISYSHRKSKYNRINGRIGVMTVGGMALDKGLVSAALVQLPEYDFHFYGDVGRLPEAPNIFQHGERPFEEIVTAASRAQVGAAFYHDKAPSYLIDTSNKIRLFRALGKPVVSSLKVPGAGAHLTGVFPYDPSSPSTLKASLEAALAASVEPAEIRAWSDVVADLDEAIERKFSRGLSSC